MRTFNASRLRSLIHEAGVSQKTLAKLVGCNETSISRYMNGKQIPSNAMQEKFAQVLGLDPAQFRSYGQEALEAVDVPSDIRSVVVSLESMDEAARAAVVSFVAALSNCTPRRRY